MKKETVRDNQKGSALIPVVCVLLVLAAISLSMLFAAYQVYASAIQSSFKEQTKIMTESVDETIGAELINGPTDENTMREAIYTKITTSGWAKDKENKVQFSPGKNATEYKKAEINVQMSWSGEVSSGNVTLTTITSLKLRKNYQYKVTSTYKLVKDSSKEGAASWGWKKK